MVSLCDDLSTAARIIGAVNTVVNENGRLIGHNTDGIGYMQSVKDAGYDIIGIVRLKPRAPRTFKPATAVGSVASFTSKAR